MHDVIGVQCAVYGLYVESELYSFTESILDVVLKHQPFSATWTGSNSKTIIVSNGLKCVSYRERQIPCDFTRIRNLTNWTDKQNRDGLTVGEQADSSGDGLWGGRWGRKEKGLMDNSVVIAGRRGGGRGCMGGKW